MKRIARKTVVLAVSAAFALSLGGNAMAAQPSGQTSGVTVVRSIPATGTKTLSVPGGNYVKFAIPSNATTGYAYTVKTGRNSAQSTVSPVTYVAPQNTDGMVGVPGKSVVTVRPSHAGTTVVTFTLTSPGGDVAEKSRVVLNFMAD
jgi:predicted secreted protein